MKQYYPEIDAVKGIAILLVILGHSFCTFPINLDAEFPVLSAYVRSFQMPLFFIASGFLFSTNGPFAEFAKKKAWRLVVPWLVFCLLSLTLKVVFGSVTRHGAIDLSAALLDILQGHSYWFLYALTIIMVVCRMARNKWALGTLCIVSVSACAFTHIRDVNAFEMGRIVYYFPLFCFGMMLRHVYARIAACSVRTITIVTLLLMVIFVMSAQSSSGIMDYLPALSGSMMTWGMVLLLRNYKMSMVCHFGRYSLQYYLNHLLIMLPCYYAAKLIAPPILQLLTIWLLGIGISYVMLRVEMRFRFLRKLCGLKE